MTIREIVAAIRAGSISPTSVTDAFLARIHKLDPAIRAWAAVDEEGAKKEARALSVEASQEKIRGPLHGVPIGLKDVFHVAGMVTTSGAGSFAHEKPTFDAEAVTRLRRAGAVVLGKTTTTEFAFIDPSRTRNPWNLEHTPGGSSSGSAAAVAARTVPAALGTQSLGSVLRPAAYCGIVGLKPTHGRISFRGIRPVAPTVDHVGILANNVEDAALLLTVLAGYDPDDPNSMDAPVPRYDTGSRKPPRLGLPRPFFLEKATPEIASHTEAVASLFVSAGAQVDEIELPPSFEEMYHLGRRVMLAEIAAQHESLYARHAAEYSPGIRDAIEHGLRLSAADLVRAQAHCRWFKRQMASLLTRYDALLTPATPTAAPKGLSSTGDGSFCAAWTFVGFPTIAVPSGVTAAGLPIGIQLVSAHWSEANLLAVANWCESLLHVPKCPIALSDPSHAP